MGARADLKKVRRSFQDGEAIFWEGETSDIAFVIVEGKVELVKTGKKGAIRLALLESGDLFGEMGVLDTGPRSATAKALGPVTLDVIQRDDLVETIKTQPEMALAIMGKLVKRLRAANDLLAQGGAESVKKSRIKSAGQSGGLGFLQRLMGRKKTGPSDQIEIRIAPFSGTDGERHGRYVANAIEKRKGVRVRALPKTLTLESGDTPSQVAAAAAKGRQWLAESAGDLLVFGDVAASGGTIRLRFASAATMEDDIPGVFGPLNVLTLPVEFGPEGATLFHAIALAATVPSTDVKAAVLREAVPEAVDAAVSILKHLPIDLTPRERASLLVCYGNAAALAAAYQASASNANKFYQLAAQAYQKALKILTRDDAPAEWGMTQRQLGAILQIMAERANDKQILALAAEAFRATLGVITRNDFPREWAATQNRLGLAIYRLDIGSKDIDTETLKSSLSAFQAALQVYTRTETPLRWAEVMSNFAQVAQVLGEHVRNPEILEKAAQACRSALEVRKKEQMPLLWASTQNNLGSALFLLGKLTRDRDSLEGAAAAFAEARDVYRARSADKMATVTEKNLARVEQMLSTLRPRRTPGVTFDDEEPPNPPDSRRQAKAP